MNRGLGPNAGKQVLKSSKQGKKLNNIQKRDTTNGNSWCPEHKNRTYSVRGSSNRNRVKPIHMCINILTRKGGA